MDLQLLKLVLLPSFLLIGGCGGGGEGSLTGDAELCDGQTIETQTVYGENREGVYETTHDVITGECITPAVQLARGFELSIDDSGARDGGETNRIDLDRAALQLERSEAFITLADGTQALQWVDSFKNLFENETYTNNAGSFNTGDIDLNIEFLITESGYFRATTIADDDASHLAIFGAGTGQINYRGFNGAPLRLSAYASPGPRSRYNSNYHQANFLASMVSSMYAKLQQANAMSHPLRNHAELYSQSPAVLKSYFKRSVFVMRSFLYHNRMDYDALEELEKPPVQAWNNLWSPFGDDDRDPDQTLMSRSYNVDYQGGTNSDSLTYLETWSGSHTLAARTSIRVNGYYGGRFNVAQSVDEPGSRFDVVCSPAISGCELNTARNAGMAIFVKGLMPTRVEMSMNNDWALGHTAVVTASFSDWNTFGRTESPYRNNPNPLSAVIVPSSQ